MCNSKRIMNDRWHLKWRQPPSWIYYFVNFFSNSLFSVAANYITAKLHLFTSIVGRDITVCAKIWKGAKRYLEFIIFVDFGQTVYFRWQLATSLQNFIYLRQSMVEILLFVQKSKMAAVAFLDWIFVLYICMSVLQSNTHAKFRANMCNEKRIINDR